MDLKLRWENYLKTNNKIDTGLYNPVILQKYTELHRNYHNLTHIEFCLSLLDNLDIYNKDQIELAIWFHDIIYDTKAVDNEEKSAKLLISSCIDTVSWERNYLDEVAQMILATKHKVSVVDKDDKFKYFIDIDLSILGENEIVFAEYDKAIREEYSWVPEEIYTVERKKIMQGFLDREYIYNTEWFRNKYEGQARVNIEGLSYGL